MTNDILRFKGRLAPVVEVVLQFRRTNNDVLALQDLFHYLQMSVYWIQGAANELYRTQTDDDLSYGENKEGIPIPHAPEATLSGTPKEHLIFMYDELEALENDIQILLQSNPMEEIPKFWLKSALQRIIESKFCVILAALQYEALRNLRETNILDGRGV